MHESPGLDVIGRGHDCLRIADLALVKLLEAGDAAGAGAAVLGFISPFDDKLQQPRTGGRWKDGEPGRVGRPAVPDRERLRLREDLDAPEIQRRDSDLLDELEVLVDAQAA